MQKKQLCHLTARPDHSVSQDLGKLLAHLNKWMTKYLNVSEMWSWVASSTVLFILGAQILRGSNHSQRRPAWPGSVFLTQKGDQETLHIFACTCSTDTKLLSSSSPSGFYASQHCTTSKLNLELNYFWTSVFRRHFVNVQLVFVLSFAFEQKV